MESPIDIKDYIKKTEVAKKLKERIQQETFYNYLSLGGPIVTYFAIIMGGVWLGIIPIGLVGVILYLRMMKLKQALKYIDEKYSDKIEKQSEFI